MHITKERFSNIMSINWFTFEWNQWNRDDWINIIIQDSEYVISNWIELESYSKNRAELIWNLVLYGIINRLI